MASPRARPRSPANPRQASLLTRAGTLRRRRVATFARGKRPGRPPKVGARLRHAARERFEGSAPVHITWRFLPGLPNLRSPEVMRVLRGQFRAGKRREGFRLVHFGVQPNHAHLLCEGDDSRALARGLQGLAIRVARAVNRLLGRRGRLFADRYHARVLRTPTEVRWGLGYVLNNARKHNAELLVPKALPRRWLDHGGRSAAYFPGWIEPGPAPTPRTPREITDDCPVAAPTTWLLHTGWKRAGPIPTDHLPGKGRR